MQRLRFFAVLILLLCGLPISAYAQVSGQAPFATLKSVTLEPANTHPGQKVILSVTLVINPGFHINANKPEDDLSVPTVLSLTASKTSGIVVGKPVFPVTKSIPVSYAPKPIKGYEDTIIIRVPLTVQPNAKLSTVKLTGKLQAQGCNATSCFPPQSFPVNATLTITGAKK